MERGEGECREHPDQLQESFGPFGRVPGIVPESVPTNGGVRGGVRGVSPGPFGLWATECPKSVPRVSPGGHSRDTFWTLWSPGPFGAPETPQGTLARTPLFSGRLSGTLPGTLRAQRARETPVVGRGPQGEWKSVSDEVGVDGHAGLEGCLGGGGKLGMVGAKCL